MTQKQKVEAIQLVLRLGLAASAAVVLGATLLKTVLFLTVAYPVLAAATTTMVSVLCVKQTKVC